MRQTLSKVAALGISVAVVCMVSSSAMGVGYQELVSWSTLDSTSPLFNTQNYSFVIDGTTAYHGLGTKARFTKTANLSGAQVATEITSNATWAAATGSTSCTSFYGMGQVGTELQGGDSGTDSIWRIDKASGAVSTRVLKAAILAHQQITYPLQTNVGLGTSNSVTPTGEHVFYEATADEILVTTGVGTLATLVTNAELLAAQGNTKVSGGMVYDSADSLYWGNSTSDDMWKRSGAGVISQVLSTTDITNVSGESAAGFGDIFFASDGTGYFYESTGDNIMKFDPADAANTLEIYVSEAELLAGPGAGDTVYCMGEYGGELAFNLNGTRGVYVIPEPAALSLLAFGSLALLRRRR
ncbi:MAG: PEP-CTERM sorting domain-containing protein [bacterium]|nr:PEP-CTERM sorting domain-containing protein [bacterium]